MKRKIKKIVVLILFLFISWFMYNIENYLYLIKEEKKQAIFFNNSESNPGIINNDDYIMVLEIPKINLKKGIYSKNSINNDVDKNIKLLKEADMPNVDKGNLILAGHRGNTKYAYFNDLYKLTLNDQLYIYYNGYKYVYSITSYYDDDKDGKIVVHRDYNKTSLILITCKKNDNMNHLVLVANLIDTKKY